MEKKWKYGALALLCSGSLNIGLLSKSFFSSKEIVTHESGLKLPKNGSSRLLLEDMKGYSYQELLTFLTSREVIGENVTKRHLALAALVSFHHFDLERALSKCCNRSLDGIRLLTDIDFEEIIRFSYEEKWPFTAEGIFHFLKKDPSFKDPSLFQAMVKTEEFRSIQTLFHKTGFFPSMETLAQMILEGGFDLFERFSLEQKHLLDMSIARRRSLLLSYFAKGSPVAANLLLETDFSFISNQLEDAGMDLLLSLSSKKSEALCLALLKSQRSEAIWKKALQKIYLLEGREFSDEIDILEARRMHLKGEVLEETKPSVEKKALQYVVKEGDSLWKIARAHAVKVEDIISLNEMEKDQLFPGMILKIPD